MAPLGSSARLLATALLVAGLTALPAPTSAVSVATTFTQPTGVYAGDEEIQYTQFQTVSFTAGGGQANVWPSSQDIPHLARIVDVDVTVDGLTHANPDDVQLVLVQQGGPQVTLMANAGGSDDATDVQLDFDDEATDVLPDETTLSSGAYRPSAYGTVSQLPTPAPPVAGNTSLSAFDGVPVSSTWQLFAYDDDGSAATGSFELWSIFFTYETQPYPSALSVSGIGTVQDVDVKLHGFTSTYPDDLDLLLVGPGGQQVTLMSDVGGSEDPDHIELTLDDEAAAVIPDSPATALTSGSYRPSNVDDGPGDDTYPPPAPSPTGTTSLATFDGTDPNGTWRLFVVDDEAGDTVSINGGWSLDIDWDDSAAPAGSVSVAGGAAATKAAAVTLNLAATDPAPGTGITQMRFSNDGTTYAAFQPYAASAPWTLAPGDGTKTVFAQFRDQVGNVSTAVSDTIVLDTTSPRATKVKPRKNAQDVNPKAKVRVVASEALDPTTVTKGTVVLKRNGVKVKGKVTYVATRKTIVLKPKKQLKPGTYKVIVKTRITDVVGNRFDAKKKKGLQKLTWTFDVG